MEQKPNVGDRVRWSSQAGGSTTTKEGEVVYSGEALSYINYSERDRNALPKEVRDSSKLQFGTVQHGVIVRVESKTGRGAPKYYAPRLKDLELLLAQPSTAAPTEVAK